MAYSTCFTYFFIYDDDIEILRFMDIDLVLSNIYIFFLSFFIYTTFLVVF